MLGAVLSAHASLSLRFPARAPPVSRVVSLQMEKQLQGGPGWLPALDLEKWYQEVMAGFEACSPVSPPSSPPPLPAKAHPSQKPLQVYRAKMESDAGALAPRMKSGTPSSSQLNVSVLGRSPSPKVWPGGARGGPGGLRGRRHAGAGPCSPPAGRSRRRPFAQRVPSCPQGPPGGTGSLPRNLAATLQDIETKRQLALQQKGQQVIEEQKRRLAELKQRAAAEAQSQWEALHGQPPFPAAYAPLVHHSILHHHHGLGARAEELDHAYDTLSLESSDSVETSISTGNNSACSPDNVSSASGMEAGKIEEMEKMLKEAHAEKSRLMESREREMELRRQALEDERRRREQLERRLQDETARRQKLVEKEVKMREKHFSQVRQPWGRGLVSCRAALPPASRQPGPGTVCRAALLFLGSAPDAVPPHPQGGFRPAAAHRVLGPQRGHLLPRHPDGEDVQGVPGQDGGQDQVLEETLVRLRPHEAHSLLLRRQTRDEAQGRHLLSSHRGGLLRPPPQRC
uniref:Uncharacterized protein n=2 Tax=Dromaius novaehollandiae TaxID=8790 RepID=A0A8C4J864_DRONO